MPMRRLTANSLLHLGGAVVWGLIELFALYRSRQSRARRRLTMHGATAAAHRGTSD